MLQDDPTVILPDEILIQVFEYVLRAGDRPQQALFVNKHWHQISQDEGLWEELYRHFIGDSSRVSEMVPKKISLWKSVYGYLSGDRSHISEVDSKGIYRKRCLTILDQYPKLSDDHKFGYSVYRGCDRLLSSFLEKNPEMDLHFKDQEEQDLIHAIHLAAKRGHLNLFDILLTQDPLAINAQDIIGWTPLHYACDGGHTEMVAALLSSKDIQINLPGNTRELAAEVLIFGKTKIYIATEGKQKLPLHIAAEKGYLEIVELFLKYIEENKKDNSTVEDVLNKQDNWGWTPLHYACANGHFKVVEALIAAKAKTDLVTIAEENILHLACAKDHESIAVYLPTVDKKLVYGRDSKRKSVIHYVCLTGNLNLVILFAQQYEVSVLQLTTDNKTPRDLIPPNAKNRQAIISFLEVQNKLGYEKVSTVRTKKNVRLSTLIVIFLLTLAAAITMPFTPLATSEPTLVAVLTTFLGVCATLTAMGGWVGNFCIMNNFHYEIENANQNDTENLTHDEKQSLLKNQESKIPNSYATFPKEISQASDYGVKILDLEDDSSLIDQRKIKKQPVETAGQEIENHDIETGNQERVISLPQTP